jgi:hypothetical protein
VSDVYEFGFRSLLPPMGTEPSRPEVVNKLQRDWQLRDGGFAPAGPPFGPHADEIRIRIGVAAVLLQASRARTAAELQEISVYPPVPHPSWYGYGDSVRDAEVRFGREMIDRLRSAGVQIV